MAELYKASGIVWKSGRVNGLYHAYLDEQAYASVCGRTGMDPNRGVRLSTPNPERTCERCRKKTDRQVLS